MTQVLFVVGSGGVGKTTVAAALAISIADRGARTLVITVDPAKRLADALGSPDLATRPAPVEGAPGLEAAMLDASHSWEALIERHTDADTGRRLIANRYFRAIADRFPAGQAYAAAEETARLAEESSYDVLVVDTPPIGGGANFFDSPRRIRSLISGRILRLLTGPPLPGKRFIYTVTARPALRVADRILGGPLLEDVTDFLLDLRTSYDGIRRRAVEVEELIDASRSVVVTTPDPGPAGEAESLLERREHVSVPRAVILNRMVPSAWVGLGDPNGDAYSRNLAAWAEEASRHQEVRRRLAVEGVAMIEIPWLGSPPQSVSELRAMAELAGLAGMTIS